MAETISEPVYGVCLTGRIQFSLGAEAAKKNPFFFLNLILLLMHSSLLITLIMYFRVAKDCFVSLLDMVHCRYCLAKKPSLCPVLLWALRVERATILINYFIIFITSGYRVAVYQLYRFQYFFQNIKCHLIQFHVYFSSSFKIQSKYHNNISSSRFSEYFSSHSWSQNQMWENYPVLVLTWKVISRETETI